MDITKAVMGLSTPALETLVEDIEEELSARKWSEYKVRECEELGWGCSFSSPQYKKESTFIALRNKDGVLFVDKDEIEAPDDDGEMNGYSFGCGVDWSKFKFYRKDGTEIKPPRD